MTDRSDPAGGFGVSVRATGDLIVLGVQGAVDHFTAPELGAILDAMARQPQASAVVVDLARCEFMDSTGLAVVADGANRLSARGTALSLRSPSALLRKLAASMGLDVLADAGQPAASGPLPDGVLPTRVPHDDAPIDVVGYLQAQLAVTDDLVDTVLRLVVVLAGRTVSGADGASVTLRRRGLLGTVAATDQTVMDMDAGQYVSEEGPCVEASVEGRPFHAGSLDRESRWPVFTPVAQALGIKAILSSPLFVRDQPCGALNLYARRADVFADSGRTLAAAFATEASSVLTAAAANVGDDRLWHRFAQALGTRESIARAEGILMEREGIGGYDAFAMLRRSSMRARMPLRECAEDMVVAARRVLPDMGTCRGGPSA